MIITIVLNSKNSYGVDNYNVDNSSYI